MTLTETRSQAVRRARGLNRISIGWNFTEAGVALALGVAASSVSLIGFGADSVIEVSASLILAWRLHQERKTGCKMEGDRRATRAIAVSLFALAAWVAYAAVDDLLTRDSPEASIPGVVLAAVSLVTMPFLARAKRRLAPALGSSAVIAEAEQTQICALLSGVLLIGLMANATFGWWWADPLSALGIAGLAGWAGVRAWRAESLEDTCC
ncbi:MAG TPA: cation transporter [Actinomycetota bacterium]|jgi:divalent metal cation (Fe/Co/Zn/Cd) transporter|nr:cation transporter [Actinomycetota bacterium]